MQLQVAPSIEQYRDSWHTNPFHGGVQFFCKCEKCGAPQKMRPREGLKGISFAGFLGLNDAEANAHTTKEASQFELEQCLSCVLSAAF